MIALVDCNNFYASCERLFQPRFARHPVIVLSNNDGCVVARSNEAKELGIWMGAPFFEVKELVWRHRVAVFSSNYSLYADMSSRVISTLEAHCPDVESYSIDEAFVTFPPQRDPKEFARWLRETVHREVGIPVSVGYAPTKTLAKLANRFAKKGNGVFFISLDQLDALLCTVPVEDVWGIGRQHGKWLQRRNIKTALDLKNADPKWINVYMTVVGERTVRELRGEPCLEMQDAPASKKGMMCSRMFGRPVMKLEELEEAIACYTARAAEKLRAQDSAARFLEVFITSGRFAKTFYANKAVCHLPVPSADTCQLTKRALEGVRQIYKPGIRYTKAGVFFGEIVDANVVQGDLFDAGDDDRKKRLMQVLDQVNQQWGRGTMHCAAEGVKKAWHMRQAMLSRRYTTCWEELPIVRTSRRN